MTPASPIIGSTIIIAVLELIALLAFLISPKGTCFTPRSNGKNAVLFEICPVSESEPMERP